MKRFIEGEDRSQVTLLPECLDDYVDQDNPVRVVEAFVDQLDLRQMGFDGVAPVTTGRPAYHPAVVLKIYIYGYLNRIQSSRRLEREAPLRLRTKHFVLSARRVDSARSARHGRLCCKRGRASAPP
jgi:transposase